MNTFLCLFLGRLLLLFTIIIIIFIFRVIIILLLGLAFGLLLQLSHDLVPLFVGKLVGAGEFPTHIDVVGFLFLDFLRFVLGRV